MITKATRPTISKYNGLLNIDTYRFPHPDWRFVISADQIPDSPWHRALHGWTIRCAPKSAYLFGLPSVHNLEFDNLSGGLLKLKQEYPVVSDYVIYPSWVFDISGSCLIQADKLIIEIVSGDIAPLLLGSKTPDAIYIFQLPYCQRPEYKMDDVNILNQRDLSLLISCARKISTNTEVVLEWTKTSEGTILFHDWFEFRA